MLFAVRVEDGQLLNSNEDIPRRKTSSRTTVDEKVATIKNMAAIADSHIVQLIILRSELSVSRVPKKATAKPPSTAVRKAVCRYNSAAYSVGSSFMKYVVNSHLTNLSLSEIKQGKIGKLIEFQYT